VRVRALGPQLKESIKAFWAPGLWWEELDWAYMGVIDGHDVRALRVAVREALAASGRSSCTSRPSRARASAGRGRRPRGDGALARGQAQVDRQRRVVKASPPAAPAGFKPPPPQYTTVFGEALSGSAGAMSA
jgi:1-deoxy-D-xylulose-5-phosphate synthase